ncbi:maleylpyruvate isomerase N-terminal domain-containing protein [Nocardia farcinica]|uniref:maleylpyruvate isomerase N-terminal domain-containing protein n=1 Tax=Nocardia farcinica TaxID=37329 RepID=UPI0022B9DEA3|nr:maleylpyruvate isomerase N-terminal domain-containing protein [Nocardia farcinica]MCZ9327330.1 maleylpyruvate isomerase N-terminal domain-containing protein [Nocardia farcinica]
MIPLDTRPLFPLLHRSLLDLLRALEPADWTRPTICPGWTVADVTAHLLNDHLRRISGSRDRHSGAVFRDDETLPEYLARVNDEFVRAMRQCSPRVMIDLLAHLGPELDRVWAAMDPDAPADLAVSWTGARTSPAWLDIARDYTEYWVHQQQIRDAVARPGADQVELMRPVLVTFLHALPFALREHTRPAETALKFAITGPAGGEWSVVSDGTGWELTAADHDRYAATVRMDQDTLWRLATRGITVDEAREHTEPAGDRELTDAATTLLAVVA